MKKLAILVSGLLIISILAFCSQSNGKKIDPGLTIPNDIYATSLQLLNFWTMTPTKVLVTDATGKIGVVSMTLKRTETYSGTTDANWLYTVTFATPFTSVPSISPSIPNQANRNENVIVSNVTVNGFTLQAFSVNLLTLTYPNLASRGVTAIVVGN